MGSSKEDLRNFGLILSVLILGVFLYIGLLEGHYEIGLLLASIIIGALSFISPTVWRLPFKYWIKLGEFIGNIMSKLIMFILYFLLFTPVSIVLSLLGKDLLSKRICKKSDSYWIKRNKQPESLKRQF